MEKKRVDMHKGKCRVCNSSDTKEIEDAYLRGEPVAQIARLHDFHEDSLWRHIRYYDLAARRFSHYPNLADQIAARGMQYLDDDLAKMKPAQRAEFTLKWLTAAAKWGGVEVERHMEMPAELSQMSDEELEFTAEHGRPPTPEELETLNQPEEETVGGIH
jgi:ribonuclease BN (tRNA processing enzyme)